MKIKPLRAASLMLCFSVIAGCICFQTAVLSSEAKNSAGLTASAAFAESSDGWDPYALSGAEERLIARLVCAEGAGEPFVCKVAVAAVVFNRLKSEQYPSSVVNVILEPGAFASTEKGTFGKDHSEREKRSALRAVRLAQQGRDPGGGALCFCHSTDDEVEQRHMPSQETFRAGNMIFGK